MLDYSALMARHRSSRLILLSVFAVAAPYGAAEATSTSEPPASPPPADSLSGDITVFAAASLTEAFEMIATAFEEEHPDVDVTFNFAASSELVASIVDDGAPADVFASADQNNMDKLVEARTQRQRAGDVRDQLVGDHRRARQPAWHRRRRGPRQPRHHLRHLRSSGADRRLHPAGVRCRRCRGHACIAGGERSRHRDQGDRR